MELTPLEEEIIQNLLDYKITDSDKYVYTLPGSSTKPAKVICWKLLSDHHKQKGWVQEKEILDTLQLKRNAAINRMRFADLEGKSLLERGQLVYAVANRPKKKHDMKVWRVRPDLATWKSLALHFARKGQTRFFFSTAYHLGHPNRHKLPAEFVAVLQGFLSLGEPEQSLFNPQKMQNREQRADSISKLNLSYCEAIALNSGRLFMMFLDNKHNFELFLTDWFSKGKQEGYPISVMAHLLKIRFFEFENQFGDSLWWLEVQGLAHSAFFHVNAEIQKNKPGGSSKKTTI